MQLLQDENCSDVESNDEMGMKTKIVQIKVVLKMKQNFDHETSVSAFSDIASMTDDYQQKKILVLVACCSFFVWYISIQSAGICIIDFGLSGFNSSTVEHKNSHT